MSLDIPSGRNYDAWRIPQHSKESFSSLSSCDKLKYLCALGHLAPSTHNTQPWRFFINEHKFQIEVYLNYLSILPASDFKGRQTMISMGCAITNILIGAQHYGFSLHVEYISVNSEQVKPGKISDQNILIARIARNTNSLYKNDEDCFRALFTRKVVRSEFDLEKSIPFVVISALKQAVDGTRTRLHIVTDSVRRHMIAEFQAQADGFVINSRKFSRELGCWLLSNDSMSGLGMPGAGFGLSDEQAARIHHALLGEQPLEPEDGLRFSLAGKIGMEKSPMICFITAQKDTPEYWLDAGRTLEYIFLILTYHGIKVAVHAGIAEVALVNKMFAMTLGTTRKIMTVFRLGFTKRKKDIHRPHSPRLPLKEIIIQERQH